MEKNNMKVTAIFPLKGMYECVDTQGNIFYYLLLYTQKMPSVGDIV